MLFGFGNEVEGRYGVGDGLRTVREAGPYGGSLGVRRRNWVGGGVMTPPYGVRWWYGKSGRQVAAPTGAEGEAGYGMRMADGERPDRRYT